MKIDRWQDAVTESVKKHAQPHNPPLDEPQEKYRAVGPWKQYAAWSERRDAGFRLWIVKWQRPLERLPAPAEDAVTGSANPPSQGPWR